MKRSDFEKLVKEAVEEIPEKFRKRLDNLEVVVEDWPDIPNKFALLGLYQGVPRTKRTSSYGGVLPDKITIFQGPMERKAGGSEEKIAKLVKRVVWHEIGHHFGMEEGRVRKIEAEKFKI